MSNFWVNGIVAMRDGLPYLQLSNENGIICQLSMSEARQIAQDMLVMASRTEMDAMVVKFFSEKDCQSKRRAFYCRSVATSEQSLTPIKRNAPR